MLIFSVSFQFQRVITEWNMDEQESLRWTDGSGRRPPLMAVGAAPHRWTLVRVCGCLSLVETSMVTREDHIFFGYVQRLDAHRFLPPT